MNFIYNNLKAYLRHFLNAAVFFVCSATAYADINEADSTHFETFGPHTHTSEGTTYILLSMLFLSVIIMLSKWRFDSLKQKNIELEKAKMELENTRMTFMTFAEVSRDIMIFTDPDMTSISYISKSFFNLFGIQPENVRINPAMIKDHIHPQDRDYFESDSFIIKPEYDTEKFRIKNSSTKKTHWVLMSQYRFCSITEIKTEMLAIVISDITELVKSEEQRKMQDILLAQKAEYDSTGEMVRAISHQWRQPLNSLSLCTQMMKEQNEKLNDKIFEEHLSYSETLIDHMSSTISDFRHFFKKDSSENLFDATETVLSTLRIIEPHIKDSEISYNVSCRCSNNSFRSCNSTKGKEHSCRYLVKGLPNEFRHAVINIIQNAKDELIRHEAPKKTIDIEIRCNGRFELSIKDNGKGISKEFIQDIFNPDFTQKQEGSGLGLHLTKQIIEKMDGKVWAEDTGEGAMFTISMPVTKAS